MQKPLTEKISFTDEKGEEILVSVSYPWLPPKCKICSHWGHLDKDCSAGDKVKIASKTRDSTVKPSSEKLPEKIQATSASGQELAQNLLRDLKQSSPFQITVSEKAGMEEVAATDNNNSEEQWITVKRHGNSSSPSRKSSEAISLSAPVSPTGFRLLPVEGEEDLNIQNQAKSAPTSSGETEEGEVVDSDQEEVLEEEENLPIAPGHTTSQIPKINSGRHRSRSRGPAKPITQRKVTGHKGSKKTSSRKL